MLLNILYLAEQHPQPKIIKPRIGAGQVTYTGDLHFAYTGDQEPFQPPHW